LPLRGEQRPKQLLPALQPAREREGEIEDKIDQARDSRGGGRYYYAPTYYLLLLAVVVPIRHASTYIKYNNKYNKII
jgi:hypothetical protein